MNRMLSRSQIQRIEAFRIARRLDVVQLKLAMNAPFRWATLLNALRGRPIEQNTYGFLVLWLEQHSPERAAPDGKAAAAGDVRKDDAKETTQAIGALREDVDRQ